VTSLRTEQAHPDHPELDRYPPAQLVATLVADQALAAAAVLAAQAQITQAVEAAVPRLRAGGRLVYVGAGTSGRLGLLDSVELLPTFNWPAERARALLAGGPGAVFQAVEGAEDNQAQGQADLLALLPQTTDVVLLIAASGGTPYALGAAAAARSVGALTVALCNNPGSPLAQACELAILLDTGPELISGSTRLKAGTAQKIALNTFSSAVMVRLHKVYGNLMVDLRATNAKLVQRALRLTVRASGTSPAQAHSALDACGWRVKTALVMLKTGLAAAPAQAHLDRCDGNVHQALLDAADGLDAGVEPCA
jgi:N-acetylmuramic acid 6-phosphate etherase